MAAPRRRLDHAIARGHHHYHHQYCYCYVYKHSPHGMHPNSPGHAPATVALPIRSRPALHPTRCINLILTRHFHCPRLPCLLTPSSRAVGSQVISC
ncbi:uncharacterized protein SETTUDRAFT_163788 [Exserohilum turcica Et28A]|uniref:Uncharacterized protein n=1 Tax=Exserohilum turcicum (strain 28A) TaxID=671987 RepID=R0IJH4_EXST2|nr:uncharacterized protein SETTUDRAFT_163788 [Exserohilum turcica Et28A]EOA85056.1 hypothetical protein SETTUDRAFT_163788 [Exserohilum turcica Et28A]